VIVVGMALLLVGLHAATYLLNDHDAVQLQYDLRAGPAPLSGTKGSSRTVIPTIFGRSRLITLVTTGFLHGGWLHVLVNSLMLARLRHADAPRHGSGLMGDLKWLLLFLAR